MDTMDKAGFVENGVKYASGDDFDVEGRTMKLLRLTAGSQAKARHESWKKRPVDVPQSESSAAVAKTAEPATESTTTVEGWWT
jgi:hypothetical protein